MQAHNKAVHLISTPQLLASTYLPLFLFVWKLDDAFAV